MNNIITSQDLERIYKNNRSHISKQFVSALEQFTSRNELPAASQNYNSPLEDPIDCFIDALLKPAAHKDAAVALLLLKTLKILSRKHCNRLQFGDTGLRAVLLSLSPPLTKETAAEGASVLLNVCYEKENVVSLVRTPGVRQLINFLSDPDEEVQASAAGAIQSICFQRIGRQHVRQHDGLVHLLPLLSCNSGKVLTRVVGAIQNLSTDPKSIETIRKYAGLQNLVKLLQSEDVTISGAAAGALQNVSCEVASRLILRELEVVDALAKLLCSSDTQAQICAAGALFNILGPELEDESGDTTRRHAFGKIISLTMAVAAVHETIFEGKMQLE